MEILKCILLVHSQDGTPVKFKTGFVESDVLFGLVLKNPPTLNTSLPVCKWIPDDNDNVSHGGKLSPQDPALTSADIGENSHARPRIYGVFLDTDTWARLQACVSHE